ncbi:glomulin, FKBP associated protein a [Pristis pectinata]|uniref:glomulin, FKBP associated protein a n=1 Tax=Pristis pectinata TaxID=685728 RepID=UPI00223E1D62|nr:glomulin, FKBP associated protein a [Pristis pectinata]XP_051868826.1 glomulin, FKBP associated protein a [Pristis pectinata]XP_051868827.1 glomulin, FKBP associated protein a [Pristis pectinata]XP_051868828.1 glomulin, FKBP associated protein a [Pristis pectinata]XP_051868829.1 glomulin, FKBP associated protein a [Pristis pectinata]
MALEELRGVIKRCRGLPETEFKDEDHSIFQLAACQCLEEGHAAELLKILQDEQNKDFFICMGWNLVGPVVNCTLKDEQQIEDREIYLKILDHVVEISNPKELLLGLLEKIEDSFGKNISKTILLLLQPLQTVLLKMKHKKAYSVGLALATIQSQLSKLPVPINDEQHKQDAYELCKCYMAVSSFVKPFLDEVTQTTNSKRNPSYNELKEELLKFFMKCLEYPLLTAQLQPLTEEIEDNSLRVFAAEIVVFLVAIGESLPALMVHQLLKSRKKLQEIDPLQEDIKYPTNSLASLAYLLFVQQIGIDQFPAVYSPAYLLQFNLEYISALISRTEESILSKGLELYECCLLKIEDNHLSHKYLEIKNILGVPQDLVKVMTLCPFEHVRKWSLKIFQQNIDKFDSEGKYKLFRCLWKTTHHAGVQGYIIQNIKNQIDLALKTSNGNGWFSGPQLIPLLHLVLSLPEGAETDLLQNSDRIMESLNLLRYLVIRDNEWENRTGLWTDLFWIENFLKPLRTGLNMSKAHYEAEIRNKRENQKIKDTPDHETQCSLTVGGKKLPKMTNAMQLEVLQSAIYTFDVMESVQARIEELMELKMKSRAQSKNVANGAF